MAERFLVPLVVLMMGVAGLYAFDNYYQAGGADVTGFVVNTAQGVSCSETDSNNPNVVGVTSSDIYESGTEEDRCVGSQLLEFYCGESGPDVRIVDCPRGCDFGQCN